MATTTTTTTSKLRMDVQRALIDKDFDRYALATSGVDKLVAALPAQVLEPLAPAHTVRKAQWDARVHYNALVADPFVSDSNGNSAKSVAYYVSAEYELMQVIFSKVRCDGRLTHVRASEFRACTHNLQPRLHWSWVVQSEGVRVQKLFQFPLSASRTENVSLQVAGRGLIVYSDGHSALVFLRAETDPLDATAWRQIYECSPLSQSAATLLVGAAFDDATEHFHVLATELIDDSDKDAVYRLHAIDVFSAAAAADDAMAVDSSASGVGLTHRATEVATLSSLPSFVSFRGSEVQVLVEGKYELMVEVATAAPAPAAPASAPETAHAVHKRHHDDSDFDDSLDEVLAKLPRAGIGYHGDISDTKHATELALDLSTPLEARFQKSSTPYSTLDEPLHSAGDSASRMAAARDGKLDVPTTESILGGFEECDDVDPNATAALVTLRLGATVAVHAQFEVNYRAFRFLCASAQLPSHAAPTLLFQHDVHGLVFASNASDALAHTATLPAFGFVQASKQQKKFLTVHPSGAFACIGEFEKRVFVYHGAASDATEAQSHTRKQHVLELGDHQLFGLRVVGDSAVLVLTPHHVVALTW